MKLSSKNNLYENLIICIISIILVIIFLVLDKNNLSDLYYNEVNTDIIEEKYDIDTEIEKYQEQYNVININHINNNLTDILYYDRDVLKSIIIDNNTGDIIEPIAMFNENDLFLVNEKINQLLLLKYAKYIVESINSFSGDIIYEFKNDELVLYYKNFTFDPEYNEDVLLHVNYNEIDNYLNFKHHLDKEYKNEDGYELDPNKTTVAISFDDGPNSDKTTRILNTLEDYKMSATFFVVGYKMDKQRDIIKKVLNSHSEIGSHTYNHINMKRVNSSKVTDELEKNNNLYKEITGMDFKLVRPPYGAYTDEIIKNYENSFILWNVDTNDWRYKNVDYLVDYILTHIEDGNIILMHDSYESSVEAVLKAIPILYSKGIQVVSVSTLASLKNINLQNGKAYHYLK